MQEGAIAPSPSDTPERLAFYARIGEKNLAPLWTSLAELVTPEPRSPCRPAAWRFDEIRAAMLEAGDYAVLIEAGIIPEDELETYGADDSRLPMSAMASYTPGMEISGGSLGQGLAIAEVADALRKDRIEVGVLHSPTIKPLDAATIIREASRPGRLVVVAENHSVVGGLGEAVAATLLRAGVAPVFRQIALPDAFLDAGALPTLHDRHGISAEAMGRSIREWLSK